MEKLVAGLVGIWLVCGTISAFLIVDKRPLEMADFALGPISLAEAMR